MAQQSVGVYRVKECINHNATLKYQWDLDSEEVTLIKNGAQIGDINADLVQMTSQIHSQMSLQRKRHSSQISATKMGKGLNFHIRIVNFANWRQI